MLRILPSKKPPIASQPHAIDEDALELHRMRVQIEADNLVQVVIGFTLDVTILDANENFLKTMGYTVAEAKGRYHRIFVDPEFAQSREYTAFWN